MDGNQWSFKAKTIISTRAVRKTGEATRTRVMTDKSLSSQVFIFTALMTPTGMATTMAMSPAMRTSPRVVPMR